LKEKLTILIIAAAAAISASLPLNAPDSHAAGPGNDSSCFYQQVKEPLLGRGLTSKPLLLKEFQEKFTERFKPLTTPEDNRKFAEVALAQNSPGRLFYEMENPILKEMNEALDMNLATAVTNKYKQTFFDQLNHPSDPGARLVREHLIAKYTDYKAVRLALNRDTPELRAALGDLYRRATQNFQEFIGSYDIRIPHSGIARDPAAWQLAGFGSTADEAGISARFARVQFPLFAKGEPLAQEFEKIAPLLKKRLDEIESHRSYVQRVLPKDGRILLPVRTRSTKGEPTRYVLSPEAIQILRAVEDKNSFDKYINKLQDRLTRAFGTEVTKEQTLAIQEYYRLADTFTLSLLQPSSARLPYESAHKGLVSVDFSGLGAKNTAATMEALLPSAAKKSESEYVQNILVQSKKNQDEVTRRFVERKQVLEANGMVINPDGKMYFSGDDGIFAPTQELSPKDKLAFLDRVSRSDSPSGSRIVFLNAEFKNKGRLSGALRESLIGRAERIEKQLRIQLERPELLQPLQETNIAVDLVPWNSKTGMVDIILSGPGSKNLALKAAVEREFRKIMNLPQIEGGMRFDAGAVQVNPLSAGK